MFYRFFSSLQYLTIGVLQGIAGGTLLYITFYEVLEKSRLEKAGMAGIIGCFFVLLGFAAMTAIEGSGECGERATQPEQARKSSSSTMASVGTWERKDERGF